MYTNTIPTPTTTPTPTLTSNSTCFICKKRFNDSHKTISVLNCGHLIHNSCITNTTNTSIKHKFIHCNLCNDYFPIESYDDLSKQKKIDIHSLSVSEWTPSLPNYLNILTRVPKIIWCCANLIFDWALIITASNIPFVNEQTLEHLKTNAHFKFFNYTRNIFNININWIGFENYDINQKKILISNHVSYYDAFVIGTKIKCGAVMSSSVDNPLVRIMQKLTECVVITRGEKNNTVRKIESHVDTHNQIFICPQGIFSHYRTITRFRNGAFSTKYNVQPFIIKYKQNVSSMTLFNMLLFDRVDVDVIVMKPITKSENITPCEYSNIVLDSMIKESGFTLSNVTSVDVKD